MTVSSASAPTPHPVERTRPLPETLTSDAEQRVIISIISRLTSWKLAYQAHPRVRRWGVPALCAALGVPSVLYPSDSADVPLALALSLAFAIPLLWRERRPMLVFALITAVAVAALHLEVLTGADTARVVALFNVGRFCTPRQLAIAVFVTIAQLAAWAVVFTTGGQLEHATRPEVVAVMAIVGLTAVAGLGLAGRLADTYISALEKERDQRARLATAQERARVSREMHDILGHTLAVIVGLANGAAGLTESSPKRGADTLRTIADSGREALAELRRLLTVIHDDPGEPDDIPLAPQPGLADLDTLLERVRAAGPSVTLHTEGDLTGLAPGLQLTVYRIVQEALTNTLKYAAPDTAVHARIAAEDDLVRVTVEDTGPHGTPEARRRSTSHGQGLVGMRERVALYQGSTVAGPSPRGGWTVRAILLSTPPTTVNPETHPS
ncbi:histidine kinase [Streptomyces sp. NPDC048251]|uniref:sensor histidine kinase n=1 Tax=Streptomyces sp. NPDC048251 TaxID=3154501 RepID=UPI00342DD98E